MQSTLTKISELKLNPKNPRTIRDAKFKALVESIKSFPRMLEIRPIVVNEEKIVLGGNMRLKACQAAGLKEIPVIHAKDLTPEQQDEFIIKDNVGFGEWNYDQLANEWNAEDLIAWGLDIPSFEPVKKAATQDDDTEDVETIVTDIKPGDLIEIGPHRILCGDSTNPEHVEELMQGEYAELAHNDPPYGMKKENEGVQNDNLNYADLLEFNRKWITIQLEHLTGNASFYCWGIDEPLMDIYSEILKPEMLKNRMTFRNLITWDKANGQGQLDPKRRMFSPADEKCLFVMLGVQGFNTNSDNYFEGWEPLRLYLNGEMEKAGGKKKWKEALGTQMGTHYFTTSQWLIPTEEAYLKLQAFGKPFDAFLREYADIRKEYEGIKEVYQARNAYFDNVHDNMNNVWHIDRTGNDEREHTGGHATPKPIALCERVIKSSSREGSLVVDFFLGSGSTMVTAHQLGRKCYGLELDPRYCQVVVNRMLAFNPHFDVKISKKSVI